LKIVIDRLLCDANALCVAEAPELLALDANEELMLLKPDLAPDDVERARRAVAVCPKAALSIED